MPPPDALTGANAWPAPLDALSRERMLALHANASALALRLAAAFSAALGLDGDPLGALCEGGDVVSMMRVFHYFASNVAPSLAPGVPRIGSSPHTDWHFLTLIVQDRGGLQVQARDGRWVDVPARSGEAILIVGDYASALSEGAFRSPVHRVLLPPAGEERTSFTFFFYARFDAKIPPAAARAARRVEAENAARPPSAPAQHAGQVGRGGARARRAAIRRAHARQVERSGRECREKLGRSQCRIHSCQSRAGVAGASVLHRALTMATLGQLFSLIALGCSVATCATGVIGLIQTLPQVGDILAWWSSLIVQIYLVLWSLLIVGATAAQFRNSKLLDLFAFLRYRAGLGALLLMNGALAFGTAATSD